VVDEKKKLLGGGKPGKEGHFIVQGNWGAQRVEKLGVGLERAGASQVPGGAGKNRKGQLYLSRKKTTNKGGEGAAGLNPPLGKEKKYRSLDNREGEEMRQINWGPTVQSGSEKNRKWGA